jgi:hypothetical protein
MLRIILILSSTALFLTGCGKETEAEKQEKERQALRETKRKAAIEHYKNLSENFPNHEHANEAADKVKALQAQQKK